MDDLVEQTCGRELFSAHLHIMLKFMCGIHNYTKDLTVQDLHSFVMKGAERKLSLLMSFVQRLADLTAREFSF